MKGLPAPKVSPQTIVNNQIVAAVINQELHRHTQPTWLLVECTPVTHAAVEGRPEKNEAL